MPFYAATLALLLLPYMFSMPTQRVSSSWLMPITFAFGIILIIKGDVGTDTSAYLALIQRVRTMSSLSEALEISEFESGFTLLIFITTRVFDSDFIGINIIAIAVLAIFTKVIYKLPESRNLKFGKPVTAILF